MAIVEQRALGGECGQTERVPIHALLRAAHAAHEARGAGRLGIRVEGVTVDFPAVMDRVRRTVAEFSQPEAADRLRATGIDVSPARPRSSRTIRSSSTARDRLHATKFVIATGSRPGVPPIPGLLETPFLTSRTVWSIDELPESLLILGGGPVGLEFGQAFARLGTQVTVLDENPEILHAEEPDGASGYASS